MTSPESSFRYGEGAISGRYLQVCAFPDAGLAAVAAEIGQGRYDRLVIAAGRLDRLADLGADLSRLRALKVEGGIGALDGLEAATQLRSLHCDTALQRAPVALAGLAALEELILAWDRRFDREPALAGVFRLPRLSSLTLRAWSGADLTALSGLPALSHLDLRQGTVGSTQGLEGCAALRTLELGHLSRLATLSLPGGLTGLHLESCPALSADVLLAALAGLPKLERLHLEKLKLRLPSLTWLRALPALRKLTCAVEVDQIDLGLLARHPALSDIACRTHEGYVAEAQALKAELQSLGADVESLSVLGTRKLPGLSMNLRR